MLGGRSRQLFDFLRRTPFHPQWLIFRSQSTHLKAIGRELSGMVLDIGCGHQDIKKYLTHPAHYIGLDYYQTATEWYKSRPHIFGDAQSLPVVDAGFDHAILLDVLEHLPCPDDCIREIHRVLKPGGRLTLQTPFLYPIHDSPRDYQRWTIHGLRRLAANNGMSVERETALLAPLENAALLTNLAIAKSVLDLVRRNLLWSAISILAGPAIVVINIWGWLASWSTGDDAFMAHGYRMTWKKSVV